MVDLDTVFTFPGYKNNVGGRAGCPQRAGVRRHAFWRVLPSLGALRTAAPYLRPLCFKNSFKMHLGAG